MNIKSVERVLIVILLAGCSSATPVPPTATTINTAVPPTEQSQPTKTATAENLFPTTTPEVKPSLAFNIEEAPTPPGGSEFERNSPYLVYLREGTAGEEVAQVDEHGTSGWVLPSPINPETTNSSPRSLSSLVSPDGKWMAFYSGSTATGDLTLNIMKMTDGASSPITPLLSPDYPGNFDRGAAGIGSSVVTAQDLQQTFEYGITRAIAWSPDSKHLAFAGQMRGDSSDLYLWDAGTHEIQQLSSGREEMEWITWSPDGKWIFSGSSYFVGAGMTYSIFATSADGKTIKGVAKDATIDGEDIQWINPHTILMYKSENGPGNYQLQTADIESGRAITLWSGAFYDRPVAGKMGNSVVIYAVTPTWPYDDTNNPFVQGYRIINTATNKSTTVNLPDDTQQYTIYDSVQTETGDVYIMADDAQNIYFVTSDGTVTSTGIEGSNITAAPDERLWAAVSDAVNMYNSDGKILGTVDIPNAADLIGLSRIVWRPDSSGVVLATSMGQLYMVDFDSKGFSLMDDSWAQPIMQDLFWVK